MRGRSKPSAIRPRSTGPQSGLRIPSAGSPPAAPSDLTATVLSGTSVKLDWTSNSAGSESGFRIEQDEVEIDDVGSGVTTYTVTGLTVNTEYDFRVRAYNGAGNSDYTSTVAAEPLYQKGYPFFTANGTEPNVAAQWVFDEASGDVVDEVDSVTLADAGSPTYSVAATGAFEDLTPGITTANGNPPASYFFKAGDESNLDLLQSDFVIEFWLTFTETFNGQTLIECWDDPSTEIGWALKYNGSSDTLVFSMRSEDNTSVSVLKSIANLENTGPRKIRITGDRDGNVEMFLDGVSLGTSAITTLSAKDVLCHNIYIASNKAQAAFSGRSGTIHEFRLTVGNLTNNSGGPAGG